MNPKYKIIASYAETGNITLNFQSARNIGIENKKVIYIRFGIKTCEVKINISEELSINDIILPYQIISELRIPMFPRYELVIHRNEIIIGPFIGILANVTEENLKETVSNLTSYVYNYEKIGGAILAFSIEGIDQFTQSVKGYVFNPEIGEWKSGIYNYPASIFKKTGISRQLRNHFRSLIGNTIFNNYIFNKWEAHQWLKDCEGVKQHIPETDLYKSPKYVREFLKEHEKIYIKPIYGSQGKEIVKLEKKGKWYFVQYNNNDKTSSVCFRNTKDLNYFLKSFIKKDKYIIQKSLDLLNIEESTIDFRLLILKNQYAQWQDIGMIARHGVKGNITSNVSSGGNAEIGEVTLKNSLLFSDDKASKLRTMMSHIAIDAAKGLEKQGLNCGNLGVDMGIDIYGCIWIIEINNIDPNHTIAIDAGDKQIFYQARLLNMLYAKRLAGFGGDDVKVEY